MKKTFLPTLAVAFGIATQATAAWVPSHYRCAFDQLTSDQARGRQSWAKRWADADPYNISTGKDQRFWATVYNQDAQDALNLYNTHVYPVYVDPNTGYEPWRGPGALGTDTAALTGNQIDALNHLVKPVHIVMDGVCEPGCYTPDQKVLFQDGYVPIQKAQEAGTAELVTLSPDASFGNLRTMPNTVERYTLDRDAVQQDILVFRTRSGGSLSVTLEHPLVTAEGSMKKAKDFVAGEHLVRQDGTTDEITGIQQQAWFGKVYNLRPVTHDLTSNILVAEGYLNGSGRFQSEYVEELNRLILRVNVPDELIP
ncbi:Hint domain-containing protein [Myxococcus sp. AB056]|uniref:Hint domain-containing protein n=1 Tax=Myxococcus sp. AB056 TaxID=2562792 RepID=UPI00114625CD|nr:Hint domain-containing protein [Myxococcus sp. AB056]